MSNWSAVVDGGTRYDFNPEHGTVVRTSDDDLFLNGATLQILSRPRPRAGEPMTLFVAAPDTGSTTALRTPPVRYLTGAVPTH